MPNGNRQWNAWAIDLSAMKKADLTLRLYAFLGVLVFVASIWLYVREFPYFSNTIGVGKLVGVSLMAALLLGGGILWFWKAHFKPWERHLPQVLFILLFCPLFAPLLASLLNRSAGETTYMKFEFIAETPYFSSNYGLLKGEKIRPTGYFLAVRDGDLGYRFRYKQQAYYPLTKPGETILLPVKKGLLGFQVVLLY